MKIEVVTEDFKMKLPVPLPTFLIRGIVIEYALKGVSNASVKMSKEQSRKLAKAIRKCAGKYKGLTIVDVESSDGEIVKITL